MLIPIRDHNPSRRIPIVTYGVIATNIIVYLSYRQQFFDGTIYVIFMRWAMIPYLVSSGEGIATLVTSMFLHAGVIHIASNMLALYIFGDNVEDSLGRFRFLLFYLASGLAAGVFHIMSDPLSQIPTLGASGAVAGVMGGYMLLFPKARVDVLIIIKIFAIRAWVFLGFWFALQFFLGSNDSGTGGGVAYWAHVGGFAAGFLFISPLWLRLGGTRFWAAHGGSPDHPEAAGFRIPRVIRRRARRGGKTIEGSGDRPARRGGISPWGRNSTRRNWMKKGQSPWSRRR
ncbi:MAG: rhomboid family intramembrane serine protease [Albidovulum sp.]|nr:rhomboid family intramembrane serine protease [Albidovulum sp.]